MGLPIKNRSRITSTQLVESPDPTARGSYFSANVITKSSEEAEATSKLRRLRFLSDDPRSPSVGIVRTPIEVGVYHFRQISVCACCQHFKIVSHIFRVGRVNVGCSLDG